MWQYSSTGKVSGVSVPVDMDYCYVDYPSVIKAKGLNGFKATNTSTSKVLDSSGFKKGDKSDGVLALKQLLMLAGYKLDNNGTFGDGTLKAVNALLKSGAILRTVLRGLNLLKSCLQR